MLVELSDAQSFITCSYGNSSERHEPIETSRWARIIRVRVETEYEIHRGAEGERHLGGAVRNCTAASAGGYKTTRNL